MDIVSALKTEASKLQQKLDGLNSAIKALGGGNSVGRPNGRRKKRHFSAASKAKMAASQRARWKALKAAAKKSA